MKKGDNMKTEGNLPGEKVFAPGQFDREREYWLDKLSGGLVKTGFPPDFKTTGAKGEKPGTVTFAFPAALFERLMEIIDNSDHRLHMVLVTALVLLLYKYTGNTDIIIGTPIYKQEVEDEPINTFLPLRNRIDAQISVKEFLMQVRQTINEAGENQNYPMETIPYDLDMPMVAGDFPLFDTALLLQNIQDIQHIQHINPNLILSFLRAEETLEGVVEYNSLLFSRETVVQIIGHYIYLVQEAFNRVDLKLIDVPVLTDEEKNRVLMAFNRTGALYPREKMIQQLFEEQAEKTPGNIAVESNGTKLTYSELNEKANQLARILRKKGISPNRTTAILLEPSPGVPLAIMAVLKAGGAYLPIGIEYPRERCHYLLKDSEARVLLTGKSLAAGMDPGIPTLYLEDETLYNEAGNNLEPVGSPDSLAYVIYTSGSTGQPKGVTVHHRALVNYAWWAAREYVKNEKVDFPLYTSISFDLTVTSIFTPLITGNAIIVYGGTGKKFYIEDVIEDDRVGAVKLTPSHLKLIRSKKINPSRIKCLIVGGEELETRLAGEIYNNFAGKIEIYNEYGPTETVVGSMIYRFNPGTDHSYSVPIGRPIANTRVYLLNRYHQPVPAGAAAELFISGDGLSRGYLHNPQLTEEKFIPNPFVPGKKMYRTGDLAVRLPDGNIEYRGRIDHQVKIRGYRVETGEITAKIVDFQEMIRRETKCYDDSYIGAAVTAVTDEQGEKSLCAYILADKELDVSQLKAYLARELPDYMIPLYFVKMDKFPLTPNGKIDLKALPKPGLIFEEAYVAPRNREEEKLVDIWSELLGISRKNISIDSDFFQLGAHSLKAAFLISQIQKTLGKKIQLTNVFQYPTIRKLAGYLQEVPTSGYSSITITAEKEYYPTSPEQKRLYIINQLVGINTAYNMTYTIAIEGVPDTYRLQDVFKVLRNRHAGLRTSFHLKEGQLLQKIHQQEESDFTVTCMEDRGKTGECLENFIKPFDLSKPPLIRAGLIKTGEKRYILVIDMHHIISDGISMKILLAEFENAYKGNQLSAVTLQYKDYAQWVNTKEFKRSLNSQEEYWLNRFSGEIPLLNLPTDYTRPMRFSFEGDGYTFALGETAAKTLKDLALKKNVTLYTLLISIYFILLARLSGQEDIIIGILESGRRHKELENIFGMFIRTLPLRSCPRSSKGFGEFLAEMKQELLTVYENQDYPFNQLVKQIAIEKDLSRNALFDTMLVYLSEEISIIKTTGMEMPGLQFSRYPYPNSSAKFDLIFIIEEADNNLFCTFEYYTRLFKKKTIERYAGYFKNIISSLITDSTRGISGIDIIPEAEKTQILYEFNHTDDPVLEKKVIQELIQNQSLNSTDKISAVHDDKEISYDQLNKRANQLAHYLREEYQVKPHDIIAISVTRSIEMITAVLGIIKAGAAYLAIDPYYPEERLSYMLKDCQAKIAIIDCQQPALSEAAPNTLIDIQEHWRKISLKSSRNPGIVNSPTDTLYVNYTSGTTGTPNGAILSHGLLSNLTRWQMEKSPVNAGTHVLQFTSLNFCVSFQEIIITLSSGGKVYLIDEMQRQDIKLLMSFLSKFKIETLYLPFSYLNFLFNQASHWNRSFTHCLKHIVTAGEQLKITASLKEFLLQNPGIKLHNHYGSTEMHVVTSYTLDGQDIVKNKVPPVPPVGKPIANTKIYILDPYRNPVPIGVCGELCIEGSWEISGYINKPGLTAQKLEKSSLTQVGNKKKLYLSGDIGCWLDDGNIQWKGRKDSMVKVRGFRIELAEIENKIVSLPSVRDCVVEVKKDGFGMSYLVAYILKDDKGDLDIAAIERNTGNSLPKYMTPKFVLVDNLPRLPSGKVDRSKLTDTGKKETTRFNPPQTDLEKKLAAIWAEVLEIDKQDISTTSNFFDLGGHSLKATILVLKIHKSFNINVTLTDIFTTPVLSQMVEFINQASQKIHLSIAAVEKRDYYHLSSAQNRVYILQQIDENSTAYNMPLVIPLDIDIDEKNLEASFKKVIKRHESFRTSFVIADKKIVQKIHEPADIDFKLHFHEMSGEVRINQAVKDFKQVFSLTKPPLLRSTLIKTGNGTIKNLLLLDMHHIISDGISLNILYNGLMVFYKGDELPVLRVQYKDFARWQQSGAHSAQIARMKEYWLNKFKGNLPVINLPTDFARPAGQESTRDITSFVIEAEQTQALRQLAGKTNATLYITALTLFYLLLAKISGQEDIVIGTSVAGRNHADLEEIIGMFVNTLPLRNFPGGDKTFIHFLNEIKNDVLEAFENQEYPFEDLLEQLKITRDTSRNPLFDVLFSYHNFDDSARELPGEDPSLELPQYETHIEKKETKYDLHLTGKERGNRLSFVLEFKVKLFKKETIETFVSYFKEILQSVITDNFVRLKDIKVSSNLSGTRKKLIKDDFEF